MGGWCDRCSRFPTCQHTACKTKFTPLDITAGPKGKPCCFPLSLLVHPRWLQIIILILITIPSRVESYLLFSRALRTMFSLKTASCRSAPYPCAHGQRCLRRRDPRVMYPILINVLRRWQGDSAPINGLARASLIRQVDFPIYPPPTYPPSTNADTIIVPPTNVAGPLSHLSLCAALPLSFANTMPPRPPRCPPPSGWTTFAFSFRGPFSCPMYSAVP